MFGPLVAKPGSSKNNQTGSWRMLKKPEFLHKNCIGCGMCKLICPEACVDKKDKNFYEPDYSYCKGCGLCSYVCPKKDIIMVEEK